MLYNIRKKFAPWCLLHTAVVNGHWCGAERPSCVAWAAIPKHSVSQADLHLGLLENFWFQRIFGVNGVRKHRPWPLPLTPESLWNILAADTAQRPLVTAPVAVRRRRMQLIAIFSCKASILISFLHLGQYNGNLNNTVSAYTRIRVLPLQSGQWM